MGRLIAREQARFFLLLPASLPFSPLCRASSHAFRVIRSFLRIILLPSTTTPSLHAERRLIREKISGYRIFIATSSARVLPSGEKLLYMREANDLG